MKRLITFFALIAIWAAMALAHDFEVNDIYYVINSDGTSVSVSYKGTSYSQYTDEYSGSVSIPPYVAYSGTYYDVTRIYPSAFRDCSGLISVTIPNSVTWIGPSAFDGCSGLNSVTIPNSVTSIGSSAFNGCSSLSKVEISDLAVWCEISFGTDNSNPLYYAHHLYLNGSEIKDLVIPSTITKIQKYTFQNCSGLTSVTIPNTLALIEPDAFKGCSGIETLYIDNNDFATISNFSHLKASIKAVVLGGSVTSIGSSAFSGCSGLKSVTIPNSVTSIGSSAFKGCSGLKSVTIPNSVTSIGSAAFYSCRGLTSVTIPNSVTEIGSSAFSSCSGLTSVTIPNSVTSIGERAFDGCSGIETLYIDNNDFAAISYFSYLKTQIKTLILGNSVSSIGNNAFDGCSGLTSVTIPNSVTSIGSSAFSSCSGLTSVTIPNSVTTIGGYAFQNCSGLTKVEISDLDAWCRISFNSTLGNPLYYAHHLYLNGSEIKDLVIPNSVTSIGNFSFSGCSGLTSVTIPNSVTTIGNASFDGCSGLKSVAIPNSVTSIGNFSFSSCSGLTSVTIPNSVTSIGSSAFSRCSGLTSVTIPNSVTSIGSAAFYSCRGLTKVEISDIAAWCRISFADNYSNPLNYAKHLYLNGSEIKDLVIPNTISTINGYAFYGCGGLTSATIPNSVMSIGNDAFNGCSGLKSVAIHNVISIGSSAFLDCSGLTKVEITDLAAWCGITFANAFSNPLYYASHLFMNGNEIKDLVIPSTTTIKKYAFYGCSGLTSVTIPNSVTSIGSSAFSSCSGLTSVIIPNSVTTIGEQAFAGCSGLTSLTIGKSVSVIGSYAFDGCTSLTLVTDFSTTPQTIDAYVFNNLTLSNIDLMVLYGCGTAYRAVAPWKYFKSIQEILSLNISPASGEYMESVTVTINSIEDDAEIRYTLDGTEPTSTSTLYTEPIVLNEIGSITVINAIAIKDGIMSDIETATYTIVPYKPSTPVISPTTGEYEESVAVTITSDEDDAEIRYTLDGTSPNVESTLYTEPIIINEIGTTTVKAIALKNGLVSDAVSAEFTIIEGGGGEMVLKKVWEQKIAATPARDHSRFATGFGGNLYVINKEYGDILKYNANGVSVFATVEGVGTAITSDDAGNILVNKGLGTKTSFTNWVIIEPNGTQHDLAITAPEGMEAARTDQVGRVVGNVMSEEGAWMYLAPNGATNVAAIKIANGAQDEEASMASPAVSNVMNTSTLCQPMLASVEDVEAVADISATFYARNRGDNKVWGWSEDGSEQLTLGTVGAGGNEGFDCFVLNDVLYAVASSERATDKFMIKNLAENEVVEESAGDNIPSNPGQYRAYTARKISNNKVDIYSWCPGNGGAAVYYTYSGSTSVESVASNAAEVSAAYYNLQGVRVANPSAGQIYIRVATLSDGSVRTSKVVVK